MKKKKRIKVLASIPLVFMILLIVLPMYLESRIGPIIRQKVNASITGNFDFEQVQLKLLRDFPDASLSLKNLVVTTAAPFEGDTLLKASRLHLSMGLGELFKGPEDPIGIRRLEIEGADLRLRLDSLERPNYYILLEEAPEAETSARASAGNPEMQESLVFELQSYAIQDSRISYEDSGAGYVFLLDDIGHSGYGDLSAADSELQTETEARVSFLMDSVAYLERQALQWDALLGIDLATYTYTFRENKGRINQMPLEMDGSVQLLEEGQDFDLSFRTPDSDFKNLLGLIPQAYLGNLAEVTADGQLSLQGTIVGPWDETRIPAFSLGVEVEDGTFQYSSMPLGVEAIQLNALLENRSGQPEDTFLQVSESAFALAGERFRMNASVRRLMENPEVGASLQGVIDLNNLSRAVPRLRSFGMTGKIQANLQAAFDQASVSAGRYKDVKASGSLLFSRVQYPFEAFAHPLHIEEASLSFDPRDLKVASFSGTLGQSDFNARGTLKNYLGYMLGEGRLQGQLALRSERLDLSEFQPTASGDAEAPSEKQLELPEKVALTASMQVGSLLYNGMEMKDVSGELVLEDQQLRLRGLSASTLGGDLNLEGALSASGDSSQFDMALGMQRFNISETLNTMELMQALVPVASFLEGRFNTRLQLKGNVLDDFSPDLSSLTGRAVAEVMSAGFREKQPAALQALNQQLSFFDPAQLDLKGLKTILAFENGRVAVTPFQMAYKDIQIRVAGGHSFDRQLDYTATFEVPARYLGPEVNRLLAAMEDPALNALTVPVKASIRGSYTRPEVQTDLKAVAGELTGRLVTMQKQRLTAEGKQKAQELLEDLFRKEKDSASADSTAQSGGLQELLKGVGAASEGDRKKDSAGTPPPDLEKKARNILGGLLGKKKDSASAKRKDSVKQ